MKSCAVEINLPLHNLSAIATDGAPLSARYVLSLYYPPGSFVC
jgi:hypothetical protein